MTNFRIKKRAWLRRTLLCLSCICILTVGTVFGAGAATNQSRPAGAVPTEIYLDGVEVLEDECFIVNSVTYVPLRKFSNLMDDCSFSWNGKTGTATVRTDHLYMTVQNGALYITANGHYFYTASEVLNLGGSLYVPIRPLARAFNEQLEWNGTARRVELRSVGSVRAVEQASYNKDDLYWLSRIISAEAKGEPLKGQIAVGNVVLNRTRHPSYPNTIYGVIFDRKYGTQFSPVSFGTIYQKPTESAIIAAKICLDGYSLSDFAIFFINPRIATNFWIVNTRTFEFTIGNHDFYR